MYCARMKRKLTELEIERLEQQGCSAENWSNIEVSEDGFRVEMIKNVSFMGDVEIGNMLTSVELEEGFMRPSCISDATLRNVKIGDGCLVEHVHGYINNYVIGDRVIVSNVGILSTQPDTTFGNGTVVSVLNEGGDGNVVLYDGLTAQVAQLMMESPAVRKMVINELDSEHESVCGVIGSGSRIVGVREMSNVRVGEACEVQGAKRLSEVSIQSSADAPTLIGADVVMENCIVAASATIIDGAKLYNSFIGESVHVGRGFTSESSLFFANSHAENGEACAAFCGPFTCTHHKSTLLIGGQFSFYNAGSGTNQSNHAYKMGPIHYGVLQRGAKTASGSHILWPATIGAFSMVMGKLTVHPRLENLPFSYVMASEGGVWVVPGINIRTVGTWRDVGKWPKRDHRPRKARRDLVNFAFPNPYIIQSVVEGKRILQNLLDSSPEAEVLEYENCRIRRTAAVKGIKYYDLAIRLFAYEVLNNNADSDSETGADRWVDIAGMLAPSREIERILADVESGAIASGDELISVLRAVHKDYSTNAASYLRYLLQQEGGHMFIDLDYWMAEAEEAHALWLRMVRTDAEHEFQLGDVDETSLHEFIEKVK